MSQNSQDGQIINSQNFPRVANKRRSSILKIIGNKEERDERRSSRRISFSNNLVCQELKADGTTTLITEPYKEKNDVYVYNNNNSNDTTDHIPIIENEKKKEKRRSFQNYLLQRYDENNHDDYTTIYNTLANRKGKLSIPTGTKVDVLTLFKMVESSDLSNVNKENEFVNLSNLNKSPNTKSMDITDLKSNETLFIDDNDIESLSKDKIEANKFSIKEFLSIKNQEQQIPEDMSIENSENFCKENILTDKSYGGQTFLSTKAMSLENSTFQSSIKIFISEYDNENDKYDDKTLLTTKTMSLEESFQSDKFVKDVTNSTAKAMSLEESFSQNSIKVFNIKKNFENDSSDKILGKISNDKYLNNSKFITNKTLLSTKDMSLENSLIEDKSIENRTNSSTKLMSIEDLNNEKSFFKTNSFPKNKEISFKNSFNQNKSFGSKTIFKTKDMSLEDSLNKNKSFENRRLLSTKIMSINSDLKNDSNISEKSNLMNPVNKNELSSKLLNNNKSSSYSQSMSLEFSIPKNHIQVFSNETSFNDMSNKESTRFINDDLKNKKLSERKILSPQNISVISNLFIKQIEDKPNISNISITEEPKNNVDSSKMIIDSSSQNKSISLSIKPSQSIIDTVENVIDKVSNQNNKSDILNLKNKSSKNEKSIKLKTENLSKKINSPIILKENHIKKNIKTIDVFNKLNSFKSNESNVSPNIFEKKSRNESRMFPVIIKSSGKNTNETYSIINNSLKRIPSANLSGWSFKNSRKISNLFLKDPIKPKKQKIDDKLNDKIDVNNLFNANKTFCNFTYNINKNTDTLMETKMNKNLDIMCNDKSNTLNLENENYLEKTNSKSQEECLEINTKDRNLGLNLQKTYIKLHKNDVNDVVSIEKNDLQETYIKSPVIENKNLNLNNEDNDLKKIFAKSPKRKNKNLDSINDENHILQKTFLKSFKDDNKSLVDIDTFVKSPENKNLPLNNSEKNNSQETYIKSPMFDKILFSINDDNNLNSINADNNLKKSFLLSTKGENNNLNSINVEKGKLQELDIKSSIIENKNLVLVNTENLTSINVDNNLEKTFVIPPKIENKSLTSINDNMQKTYIKSSEENDKMNYINQVENINNNLEDKSEKFENLNLKMKIHENVYEKESSIKFNQKEFNQEENTNNISNVLNGTFNIKKNILNSSTLDNIETDNLGLENEVYSPIESVCKFNLENSIIQQKSDLNNDDNSLSKINNQSNVKLDETQVINKSDENLEEKKCNSTFTLFQKFNSEVNEVFNELKNDTTIDFNFKNSISIEKESSINDSEMFENKNLISFKSSSIEENQPKTNNTTMNIFSKFNSEIDEAYKKVTNDTTDVFDDLMISLDENEIKNYYDKFNKNSHILKNLNGNCTLLLEYKSYNFNCFNEIENIQVVTDFNKIIKISNTKIWHLDFSKPIHKKILLIVENYIKNNVEYLKKDLITKYPTTQFIQNLIDEVERVIKISEILALDLYISIIKYPCELDLFENKVIATFELFGVYKEIKIVLPFNYMSYLQKPIVPKLKIFYDEKRLYPYDEIRFVANKVEKNVPGYIFKILRAIDQYICKKSNFFRNKVMFLLE